ncbi:transglycosylase SLT domain-containing protein [uncultured Desulfosarcina sp.]|uniref:lytic transglycosylase domain-containing protein n=1 Tax=uncultured Desulfosarcina sp. TaxID=218289 RepID=UPI0029C806E5|nr:transglycosylase SLT domain-containing protein [uncultured Desulfosarcina sp.]
MTKNVFSWQLLGLCMIGIYFMGIAAANAAEPASGDLIRALRIDSPLSLCNEPVPLSDPRNKERFEKEMLVSLGNQYQVILWLKRTTRFFPYIEQVLAENGLPGDIKYLAIAESALRNHAGSPKGAMGVWQLMPQTARKYGLTVDNQVDERRSFYLSTPAAVAYLKELHGRFGSWSLALAAYNMGEEGLEAEILEQGITEYYRLYLPLETQRFVFRILAIKCIVESPQHYGIFLDPDEFYPPLAFATVQFDALDEFPLRLVAEAAGTVFKTIKDLNPHIRGYYLTAGSHRLNIPLDGETGFEKRLLALAASDAQVRDRRLYLVREGDSLSGIAKKFDVPLAALLIWNRIPLNAVIHPGQRLVVLPFHPGKDWQTETAVGD